jgi:hypothetical protein
MNDPAAVFQQDNARPHTARATREFLEENDVTLLDWPSRSPDINPIEHLWDELDRRVQHRPVPPANINELAEALEEEWAGIPAEVIRKLIRSMRHRCQAVIDSNGGHTRY